MREFFRNLFRKPTIPEPAPPKHVKFEGYLNRDRSLDEADLKKSHLFHSKDTFEDLSPDEIDKVRLLRLMGLKNKPPEAADPMYLLLWSAISQRRFHQVRVLLAAGMSLNELPLQRQSPFHDIIRTAHALDADGPGVGTKLIQYCLLNGGDPYKASDAGGLNSHTSPFEVMTALGRLEWVALAVETLPPDQDKLDGALRFLAISQSAHISYMKPHEYASQPAVARYLCVEGASLDEAGVKKLQEKKNELLIEAVREGTKQRQKILAKAIDDLIIMPSVLADVVASYLVDKKGYSL